VRFPITAERVAEAMTRRCTICRAEPRQACRNLQQRELPPGTVHYYRIEAK
jgi:hypothetical protein